jgi:hypothetical protein
MKWFGALLLSASVLGCGAGKPAPGDSTVVEVPPPAGSTKDPSESTTTPPPPKSPPLPGPPRAGWPLPRDCDATACRTAGGEPGIECKGTSGGCVNPCPAGMGPEDENLSYCSRLCKSDAECPGGKCSKGGVCNFWPAPAGCDSMEVCTTADGKTGTRCKPSDPCRNPCKKGLELYGGTHCAKPCQTAAQCPGGECLEDFCVPLCPSEGCPYAWE